MLRWRASEHFTNILAALPDFVVKKEFRKVKGKYFLRFSIIIPKKLNLKCVLHLINSYLCHETKRTKLVSKIKWISLQYYINFKAIPQQHVSLFIDKSFNGTNNLAWYVSLGSGENLLRGDLPVIKDSATQAPDWSFNKGLQFWVWDSNASIFELYQSLKS